MHAPSETHVASLTEKIANRYTKVFSSRVITTPLTFLINKIMKGIHMKKICLFIAVLFLTACSSTDSDGDTVIDEADLSDFEGSLVNAITDASFIYDIDIENDQLDEMIAVVDYYKGGEKKERVVELSYSLSGNEQNDTVRLAFIKQKINETTDKWMTTFISEEGSGTAETENDLTSEGGMTSTVWGSSSMPISLSKDEEKIIAHLIYSDESSISSPNHIETEEDLKHITNYEHVYLMSMELK